jgi:PIN domain nuclease of toxin-antitoxin system
MILLDTHAVVWLLTAPELLSSKARETILEATSRGERLGVSVVTFCEIANAVRRGRLRLNSTPADFFAALRAKIDTAPLTAEVALRAGELANPFHGDPMDRIIAATAMVGGLSLITRDERIRKANVCTTLW